MILKEIFLQAIPISIIVPWFCLTDIKVINLVEKQNFQ